MSVFETLQRRGNSAAAGNKVRAGRRVNRHNGRGAEEPSHLDHVADVFAFDGNHAHGGRLAVDMPIAASSAMMAEMVSAEVSPGTAIMSSPTEQTQVIASNLSIVSVPSSAAAIMPSSSETGMNAPERPPT